MKKLFSIMLAVFMLATIIPQGAFAAQEEFTPFDTVNLEGTIVETGNVGKLTTDGINRITAINAGTRTITQSAPMSDFHLGFNVKLNSGSLDTMHIFMNNYRGD